MKVLTVSSSPVIAACWNSFDFFYGEIKIAMSVSRFIIENSPIWCQLQLQLHLSLHLQFEDTYIAIKGDNGIKFVHGG